MSTAFSETVTLAMNSENDTCELSSEHEKLLLEIARKEIHHGVHDKPRPQIDIETLPVLDRQLRGCIGSLEAYRPLARDIAENAYAAAFLDPRFPPVTVDELQCIQLHLSILSRPETLIFESEEDLKRQLRQGVDGLILEAGARRATFLPTVWEDLTDKSEFLRRLKLKAGLPANYWSDTIRFSRYTARAID
jgi:AmmeMemoRadiSam system protein A